MLITPVRKALEEAWREDLHVPGQHDQVDALLLQDPDHLLFLLAACLAR